MKSIRDLYKVGKGPSSSHTLGPERAARIFKQENPGAERYEVTLYGSLALTGVGHGTDRVLSEVLAPTPTEIIFSKKDPGDLRHRQHISLFHPAAADQGKGVFIHQHPAGCHSDPLGDGFFPHIHHFCPALVIKMGKIRHV